MLAIRMQRNGRKGQAFFRVIVQESRLSPSSGRVVAYLGSYNPHTKDVSLDNEQVSKYLSNGAQPSDRVARLLRSQKIELPTWVKIVDTQSRSTKNPEKLRKNQPKEEAPTEEAPAEESAEDAAPAEAEAPKEEADKAEDTPEAEKAEEKPAEAEKTDEEPTKEEKEA